MSITKPSIQWTDSIGAATLTLLPLTFKDWAADIVDTGDSQVGVGDITTYFFAYRDPDYVATLSVANIANTEVGLAMRLKSHLTRGGTATINTEDSDSRVYTVKVQPGTVPTLALSDTTELESTLTIQVVNTAGAPMFYTPVANVRDGGSTSITGIATDLSPLIYSDGATVVFPL